MVDGSQQVNLEGRLWQLGAEFARVAAPHTYNRRGVSREEQERDVRVGKLGEIALAVYLSGNGKALKGAQNMFTVWKDTTVVDKLDFETKDGKKVDVKTVSRDYQKRILVPSDQLDYQPKDYYVGVRITEDERWAIVAGYATAAAVKAAGLFYGARDHPAYGKLFSELLPIEDLLELMPDEENDDDQD